MRACAARIVGQFSNLPVLCRASWKLAPRSFSRFAHGGLVRGQQWRGGGGGGWRGGGGGGGGGVGGGGGGGCGGGGGAASEGGGGACLLTLSVQGGGVARI